MKTRIIFAALLWGASLQACEICGCSGAMASGGLFPQVQRNMVGLRFSSASYAHPQGNMHGSSMVLRDYMQETSVFARWLLKERFQLWVEAPYRSVQRIETQSILRNAGLGDVHVRGLFTLIQPDTAYHRFRHMLMMGGGLSLPTGTYRQRDAQLSLIPFGLQAGTGAWAGMVQGLYLVQTHRWGLWLQSDARWNAQNEDQYQKGMQWGAQASAFLRLVALRKLRVLPQLGLRIDQSGSDTERGFTVANTGVTQMQAMLGMDVWAKRWMLGLHYRMPVYQKSAAAIPQTQNGLQLVAGYTW